MIYVMSGANLVPHQSGYSLLESQCVPVFCATNENECTMQCMSLKTERREHVKIQDLITRPSTSIFGKGPMRGGGFAPTESCIAYPPNHIPHFLVAEYIGFIQGRDPSDTHNCIFPGLGVLKMQTRNYERETPGKIIYLI